MYPKAKWDRPTLKEYAKAALKNYYWWAVLACLITAFLGGKLANIHDNSGITFQIENNDFIMPEWGSSSVKEFFFPSNMIDYSANALIGTIIVVSVFFVLVLCFLAVSIYAALVANPLEVGLNRFFMENRFNGGNAPAGNLSAMLYAYNNGSYWNIVKTLFFRDLYVFLWSLLLVIPGIVKSYEYRMVPYILAENPNISRERAFQLSKQMMDGRKWDAFVFDFSFLGWRILASFVVIGHVFLNPYIEASFTEMYLWLRYDALYNNYAHPEELNGLFMEVPEYRQY